MDKIAAQKHRHELKRKAKRAQVRRQKAYSEGKIGVWGSRSRHHQQGNMPVEVPVTALAEVLAPCSVCGRPTGGCCTVTVQE